MKDGERQVAPTLEGIRRDHVARYEWAARKLDGGSRVIDFACGVGYGAKVLADAGHRVLAADCDAEALEYGGRHYGHERVTHYQQDATKPFWPPITSPPYDAAVCFETIEHVEDPRGFLRELNRLAPALIASVPNEDVFPFGQGMLFHHRHYTPDDFQRLLNECGWEVLEWWGQEAEESEVVENLAGRTLIAKARRVTDGAPYWKPFHPVNVVDLATTTAARAAAVIPPPAPVKTGLGHVVILGLGPSAEQYMDLVKRLGGRRAFADEVWAINALGDILQCDLVFHMDDVRVQMRRAEALPDSNIAHMVKWLKTTQTPVITSRAHPDFPALREFPLQDVINDLGFAYFNGTAAYACAYAIHKGASKISFFGCDFTLANAHHAEQGRACLEFWIGFAAARGVQLGMADATSLLDTCDAPKDPKELNVYGYDFDKVKVEVVDGAANITLEPRETTPTAAEIEARYDHSQHPSPLLRGAMKAAKEPTP